jgi:hypothetical protein
VPARESPQERQVPDWAGILGRARAVIETARAPEAARFLAAWPAGAAPREVAPATLPVLRWLGPAVERAPPGPLGALAAAVAAASAALGWRQSYRAGDVPRGFLERYGWCELLGRAGPVECGLLAGGVLLLGPDTHYPEHQHQAEELYVPLSGAAGWQRGAGAFERRLPGEAIFHSSAEPHAMQTGAEPLLALYLWRGDGLGGQATLAGAGVAL